MRVVLLVVAALALAGCEADGRPSRLLGSAADGFSRGLGTGQTPPPAPRQQPLQMQAPASPAPVNNAFFTGQARQVQTVSGGMAWECEYLYGAQKFLILFDQYCPSGTVVR